MIDHSQMKTGRRPANLAKVKAHLQARDVLNLSVLPSRPAARDWSMVDGAPLAYQMFLNNLYSDCVFASASNSQITQSANSGTQVAILDSEVQDAYTRFTGFNPDDPSTDNGANMLDVGMRCLRGELIAGRKLLGFVAINPKDDDMVAAAAEFFGGLWTGFDLPIAWQGASEWDVAPDDSTSGKWEPRSWGGHAVHLHSYSPGVDQLTTWSEGMPLTPAARHRYMEECYCLIWSGLWNRLDNGLCPPGIDLQRIFDVGKIVGV
jgi:hypothetical protein